MTDAPNTEYVPSGYTPTEDEMRFAMAGLRVAHDRFVTGASFDRAIARIRAKARVEALREAEAEIRPSEPRFDTLDRSYGAINVNALHYAADQLASRANRFEASDQGGGE